MDVWSLNHFHTQAPTLHEAYCTLHAAYSSSPESILKWTKEIPPLEGVEVGGGGEPPSTIGWAELGGGGGAPPPTLDGHSWGGGGGAPPRSYGMGTAGGGGWCIFHGLKVSWGWWIFRLLR